MAIKTFKIKFFKKTTNTSNIYHSHLPLGKKGKSTGVLLRSNQLIFEKKKKPNGFKYFFIQEFIATGKNSIK